MKEKVIETVAENTEAIASVVTKSGLGTRALVIGGSALLAGGVGMGIRCLFKKIRDKVEKHDDQDMVEVETEDNVTNISEAIEDLVEEDKKKEKE